MNKWRLLLILLLSGFPAVAAAAALQTMKPVVLYDAPSAQARPLLILAGGFPLKEISRVDGWYKVTGSGNDTGWVAAGEVREKRAAIVITGRAAVRVDPHPAAAAVFFAQRNVVLEVLQSAASGWLKVAHPDGETGYLQKSDSWQNF